MNPFDTFFREQRHVFGVCPNPDCRTLSRLAEIRISYRAKYAKDWLDKIQDEAASWEEKHEKLEEQQKELKAKSIEEARRTILPKKLRAVSPLFEKPKLQPEDIKLVSNPIDFIAFDGLVTEGALRRIVLLESQASSKLRSGVQTSIKGAVENDKYDWTTLRVDEEGKITQE